MKKIFFKVTLIIVLSIIVCIGGLCIAKADELNETEAVSTTETISTPQDSANVSSTSNEENSNDKGIGMIAAALAVGLAAIGSGIAVAVVASSAVGAISENPSLLGKTVIFAGLAEGIAIYGLIISIMILSKI